VHQDESHEEGNVERHKVPVEEVVGPGTGLFDDAPDHIDREVPQT